MSVIRRYLSEKCKYCGAKHCAVCLRRPTFLLGERWQGGRGGKNVLKIVWKLSNDILCHLCYTIYKFLTWIFSWFYRQLLCQIFCKYQFHCFYYKTLTRWGHTLLPVALLTSVSCWACFCSFSATLMMLICLHQTL